jgi:pyridoxamine 5'-phosphate oxidase family protein
MFDIRELEFLRSQPLARLATVGSDGQPDNVPVGFHFDGEHFWISGRDLPATRKYRNIAGGGKHVALVIDDLLSVDPWRPRGVRVYGIAEIVTRPGRGGAAEALRIRPTITWSWALPDEDGRTRSRRTDWSAVPTAT